MTVQIPGQARKPLGDDLAQPINDLLTRLNLEAPADPKDPMAMVKSDALDLTKWVAGLIGAGGLLSGVFGSFVAWNVSDNAHEALKVAIVASVAVIVTASILMVGWVTTTDVHARAETQQARYEARGQVVRGYFDLVEKADFQRLPATVEVSVDDHP